MILCHAEPLRKGGVVPWVVMRPSWLRAGEWWAKPGGEESLVLLSPHQAPHDWLLLGKDRAPLGWLGPAPEGLHPFTLKGFSGRACLLACPGPPDANGSPTLALYWSCT